MAFIGDDLVASGGQDGFVRLWKVGDRAKPRMVEDEDLGAHVHGLANDSGVDCSPRPRASRTS